MGGALAGRPTGTAIRGHCSDWHLILPVFWPVLSAVFEPIDFPNTPVRPLALSEVIFGFGNRGFAQDGKAGAQSRAVYGPPGHGHTAFVSETWGHHWAGADAQRGVGAPSHPPPLLCCTLRARGLGGGVSGLWRWEIRAGA